MNKNLIFDQTTVKNSLKLQSVLSRKDNLAIFMNAAIEKGLNADLSTPQQLGIAKKTYYTRLKQLITAGLVRKSEGAYVHTTLGSIIYQKQLEMMHQIRNIKQFKMIDALKSTKEFSEEDIKGFVGKLVSENTISVPNSGDNAHVEAKVISDKSLVRKFFAQFQQNVIGIKDKNSLERSTVVANPWYPGNIDRRATDLPFSMIILDGKEVGIELIHANDPKTFNGVIFIRDERIANVMTRCYQKIWDSSSSSDDLSYVSESSDSDRYVAPSTA